MSCRTVQAWCCALTLLGLSAPVSEASEVKFFTMNSREAFLDGELEGVSVDSLGTLGLANRVSRIGEVEEPFVFGAAAHPDGWVLGTGNSGRVLLLDRQGGLTTLLEASDPTIFAVAVAPSGVVYAGSSPGGTIYRIVDGVGEILFETGETYVWALAVDAGGDLWAATGTEGRLYRVSADGTGTIVLDADDTHLRSLEIDSGGQLLLGTGGEGLIMRLADDGSARTLYDSGLVEVVDIEAGEAGNCYAAVIAAQAGFVDMSGAQANAMSGAAGAGGGSVTVVEQQGSAAPRTNGAPGPRSQVLRFPCSGGVMETLWSFQDETVYDLLWAEGRLWIGTGQEGKLYSLRDSTVVLEKDVDERQIVAVMPDEHGPALATTNSAALYRVLDEAENRGVYTSAALDAGQIAEFGTLHWRGAGAGPGRVRFAFRSGMSSEPDVTWSGWSPMLGGGEVALGAVPPGRYLQFRAELSAAAGAPSVSEVTISYRQKNLAPKITKLEVLEAGQVLVPANFNPANQVFEPVAPNRDGIFTSLTPERERDNQRLKPLWKRGYRTIQWEAEDPNGDLLTHRIDFRLEGATDDWFRIVDELEDTYFSFDATVLPDGVYRFRVSSSDKAGNGNGTALETVRTTGPITVDHTAPALGAVSRDGDTVRVEVRDDLNALRRAEYSTDGKQWVSAVPTDGLLDGRRETFSIEIASGARLVLFRVMDSFFNLTTFDLLAESR